MSTFVIFIAALIVSGIINGLFTYLYGVASNDRCNKSVVFWAGFLFTPFIGVLLGIVSTITYQEPSVKETKPETKREGKLIYIENKDGKRFQIYESELSDYPDCTVVNQ